MPPARCVCTEVAGVVDGINQSRALPPRWLGSNFGIDLGTTNTLVYAPGTGIVWAEPSVVALHRHTREVIAVGAAAGAMLGKTPPDVVAVCPVQGGVVADDRTAEQLLAYVMRRAAGLRPHVVLGVPSGATDLEWHAAQTAVEHGGARRVCGRSEASGRERCRPAGR